MAFEEPAHVFIADELATSSLRPSVLDRGTRLFVKLDRPLAFGRDGQQHFGGLVLIGLRQLSYLLDSVLKQFAHKTSIP
jgi:hypothetical protein